MTTSHDALEGWFRGRLPDDWFTQPIEVSGDRDEIVIVGAISGPELSGLSEGAATVALSERVAAFRESTRDQRIAIAREAKHTFQRKVSWGASCGHVTEMFTTASVPVMTRLRLADRQVLDTLIDASVARSRSEALAWCVRLVGTHQGDWIRELREAVSQVDKVRQQGPTP